MSVQKIESVVWSGVYIGIRGKNCYQLRLETRAAQPLSKTPTTGLRVQQLNMLILDNFIFQNIEKNGWDDYFVFL